MSEQRIPPGQEGVSKGADGSFHLVRLRANVEAAARKLCDAGDQSQFSSAIARFLSRRLAWIFAALGRYFGALDAYLGAAESSVQASLALLRQRATERERDAEMVRRRLDELEKGFQRSAADARERSARVDALRSRLEEIQSACEGLREQTNQADERRRQALAEWSEGVNRRYEALSAGIAELSQELRRVVLAVAQFEEQGAGERRERENLAEQVRRAISDLQSRVEAFQSEIRSHHAPIALSPGLDRLYRDFQDTFRGSKDEIKSRLKVYLPELTGCGAGGSLGPVLDVACGRGEWLELLFEHGLRGEGVGSNPSMVEMCLACGLTVHQQDGVDFLEAQPEGSWGAVTVFHLVEHLTFDRRIRLLSAAFRSLASGGLLILETPNPENLLVAAHNFYMDPTHERPIPPRSLEFFVQARGFVDVRIVRLHPYPDSYRLPDEISPVAERLYALLFGPQDYAILANKP